MIGNIDLSTKVSEDGFGLVSYDPSHTKLIRVNRSVKPSYPEKMRELLYPELEGDGPAEYRLSDLNFWLHPQQNDGSVSGFTLLRYLEQKQMIQSCLSLRDLEEIRKEGYYFFNGYLRIKFRALFAWKSAAQRQDGRLQVPYLFNDQCNSKITLHWLDIDGENVWIWAYPALRFPDRWTPLAITE